MTTNGTREAGLDASDALDATVEERIRCRDDVPMLGVLLAELIKQNLRDDPARMQTFFRLHGRALFRLNDVDASVTLVFSGGSLMVLPGVHGLPLLQVTASSDQVIGMSRWSWVRPRALLRRAGKHTLARLFPFFNADTKPASVLPRDEETNDEGFVLPDPFHVQFRDTVRAHIKGEAVTVGAMSSLPFVYRLMRLMAV